MSAPAPPALVELHRIAGLLPDPAAREDLLEEIGALALRAGALPMVHELLADLPTGPLRAALRLRLAQATAAPDEALRQLRLSLEELDAPGRWRPCLDLISKAELRAEAIDLALLLDEPALARAQVALLTEHRAARARAWIALARHSGDDRAIWGWARSFLPAVTEPEEALPLWIALARGLLGAFGAAEAQALLAEAEALPPLAQVALHQALIEALLDRGEGPDAVVNALLDRIAALEPSLPAALALGALYGALAVPEPLLAEEPKTHLLRLCEACPLPPEPQSPFAWRVVAGLALQSRPWSIALRDRLRAHLVVPPAWCLLLGELERRTQNLDRARRAARALLASAGPRHEEPESLLFAGLLSLRLGDLPAAEEALQGALAAIPARTRIRWPLGADQPVEALVVGALIEAGAVDTARALIATLPGPLERAERLLDLAAAVPAEAPAALAQAISALDAAVDEGQAAVTPALYGRVARLSGPESLLRAEALALALARARALPDFLQVPALLSLRAAVHGDPALVDRIEESALALLRAPADLGLQAEGLLAWAAGPA